jgi:hypothetical protein
MKPNNLLMIGGLAAVVIFGGYQVTKNYPRGIRNNNPGNLRQANQGWRGEVGTDDAGFVIFDTMQNGVRAMTIVLINYYYRHGLKTVRGMINRYAPPVENNTDAYINHVARVLGVGTDQSIVLEPYLMQLVEVMIKHENGRGIDAEDLARGVSVAMSDRGLV